MARLMRIPVSVPVSLVLLMLGPAGLDDVSAQTRPTTLTLSQSNAPPDANVTVPVYFTAGDGVRTGSIRLSVTFPSASLAFVGAELSGLSEGLGVTVDTRVEAGADDEHPVLHVALSAAGPDAEPIPDGPLVYLVFRIAAATAPGSLIPLAPTLTVTTLDRPPRPVEPVVAPDGEIVVSKPGIVACFFYMH
jgi:hypothetical protein